jgi:hypothetical protein
MNTVRQALAACPKSCRLTYDLHSRKRAVDHLFAYLLARNSIAPMQVPAALRADYLGCGAPPSRMPSGFSGAMGMNS